MSKMWKSILFMKAQYLEHIM